MHLSGNGVYDYGAYAIAIAETSAGNYTTGLLIRGKFVYKILEGRKPLPATL